MHGDLKITTFPILKLEPNNNSIPLYIPLSYSPIWLLDITLRKSSTHFKKNIMFLF